MTISELGREIFDGTMFWVTVIFCACALCTVVSGLWTLIKGIADRFRKKVYEDVRDATPSSRIETTPFGAAELIHVVEDDISGRYAIGRIGYGEHTKTRLVRFKKRQRISNIRGMSLETMDRAGYTWLVGEDCLIKELILLPKDYNPPIEQEITNVER